MEGYFVAENKACEVVLCVLEDHVDAALLLVVLVRLKT